MARSTVADLLCRALDAEGVEVVFGYPGGAILPVYDALHRAGAPRHLLVRHEQAAAHAADGYARATGKVGVCLATSGPGATNLVTGLATALMDGVPMVAITGQVPLSVRGQDAFQETDIFGIALPVTKHAFFVESAAEFPEIVREAFRIATSGRPGPVLIDIPKDIQNDPCELPPISPPPPPSSSPWKAWEEAELDEAVRLLNEAERPLVIAGRGVVSAGVTEFLLALAERARLPVVTTLLGLDAFPLTHPLALGMPGMHGSVRANYAIQAADLILGLGLRFDDRVIGAPDRFAPHARIIHADIDPVCVGRTVRPAVRLIGDLRATLPALAPRVRYETRQDWHRRLAGWPREAEPVAPWEASAGPLTGRQVARALAERIAATGAIVATDVGQHQMLIAQELRDAAPGTHLTSGGLGTMGYALPAALGAAVGRPDRPVWAVAGDGGFQMNQQELATVVQERLPVRIAVINNAYLGMVRQWQELFYEHRYSGVDLSGPDLVQLAAAYGIPARCITEPAEVHDAIAWAEAVAGPVLIDFQVLREENVFPMVPAGASLDEVVVAPSTPPVALEVLP